MDTDAIRALLTTALIWLLQFMYGLGAVGLALYGLNAFWLLLELGLRKSPKPKPPPVEDDSSLPHVTVQLPIYNERYVVERLLNACAELDWPADRLHVQLLDDSDDDTFYHAAEVVARLRRGGVDVAQVRRDVRTGFKAGALAHGMTQDSSEFLAIFDADFVPPRDFLRRTVPHFQTAGAEGLAFVQARWDHLNADYSLLTQCQALALDGHFGVEQPARQAGGYYFGFNGSAGVWRRAAIEDARVGGWQADTLCEDLDLAYRAQMAGWRGLFLEEVTAPAEIPPQLLAFKRQQFRWAKGSVQTLVKLARRVLRAPLGIPARIAAMLHLGNYLIHPLLLTMLLTAVPLQLLDVPAAAPLGALSLASFGPPLLYAMAQRRLHGARWWQRFKVLPVLMLFGVGMSFNNSRAVWSGLRTLGGEFARTPKFNVAQHADQWKQNAYRLPLSQSTVIEFALAIYALAGVAGGYMFKDYWSMVFLGLYAAAFGTIAMTDVIQTRARVAVWQNSTTRPPIIPDTQTAVAPPNSAKQMNTQRKRQARNRA